uniref:Uncharacterized protein n=1 Tax=Plectus sambesii TaxID=2011161 RepID=A0A914X3L4_9BILA
MGRGGAAPKKNLHRSAAAASNHVNARPNAPFALPTDAHQSVYLIKAAAVKNTGDEDESASAEVGSVGRSTGRSRSSAVWSRGVGQQAPRRRRFPRLSLPSPGRRHRCLS